MELGLWATCSTKLKQPTIRQCLDYSPGTPHPGEGLQPHHTQIPPRAPWLCLHGQSLLHLYQREC